MTGQLKCVGCGCTETRACVRNGKPCAWASFNPPVCTACQEKADAAANVHSDGELEQDAKRLAELLDNELPEGVAFLVFTFTPQRPGQLVGLSNAELVDQIEATHAWLGLADKQGEATRRSDPIQLTRLRTYLLEYQTPDRAIGTGPGDVVDATIQRMVEITNHYLDLRVAYEKLREKTRILPTSTDDGEKRSAGGIILAP